jgi:acetyltransferase-like isoleucine patch superfamily enzyme
MYMIINRSRLPMKHMLTIGLLPSVLKVGYYRWRGAKIGKGVKIGIGAVILSADIEIGDGTTIAMATSISCEKLRIGKRTKIQSLVLIEAQEISIGNDVIISEVVSIRALIPSIQSKIILHNQVHIFPFSIIDPSFKVEIGDESCVGVRSSIYTHSSYKSKLDGYPVEFGEVNIGRGVWLSSNIFINQSVTIGDDAVIGTGTIVSRDIPSGALVVGSPARVIKSKEQYIVNYTDQEKYSMLINIIDEFCQYIRDFAEYTCQRSGSDLQPNWILASPNKKDNYNIDLSWTHSVRKDPSIHVIFGEIPDDIRDKWDNEKRNWFSLGSRCCSEHLNDMGEELQEYFKRYGIYFSRL